MVVLGGRAVFDVHIFYILSWCAERNEQRGSTDPQFLRVYFISPELEPFLDHFTEHGDLNDGTALLSHHLCDSCAEFNGQRGGTNASIRHHRQPHRYDVHRVSSSLLSLVDPAFRALSGCLKFLVRRHNFNKESFPCRVQCTKRRHKRQHPPSLAAARRRQA